MAKRLVVRPSRYGGVYVRFGEWSCAAWDVADAIQAAHFAARPQPRLKRDRPAWAAQETDRVRAARLLKARHVATYVDPRPLVLLPAAAGPSGGA